MNDVDDVLRTLDLSFVATWMRSYIASNDAAHGPIADNLRHVADQLELADTTIDRLTNELAEVKSRNEQIYALAEQFGRDTGIQQTAWAIEMLAKMHTLCTAAIGDGKP